MTEPGTGSDVAGVTTTARETDDGFVLDGRKMFITNAGLADVLIVAARTGEAGRGGVTLFLVERDSPGLSFGAPLVKMGWHSSDTREVVLDGVEVPADALLGARDRGFYQIMEGFQLERIALAGMGLGHAAECLDLASEYAGQRQAFGAPLTHLQTIRHRLAVMEIELESARLVVHQAAARLSAGHPEAGDVGRPGQVRGCDHREPGRRRRRAGVRRCGFRRGVAGGAALPRRADPADRRRHRRDPARDPDPRDGLVTQLDDADRCTPHHHLISPV